MDKTKVAELLRRLKDLDDEYEKSYDYDDIEDVEMLLEDAMNLAHDFADLLK